MQKISWEVMKICPLEIADISYLSVFLSVTLHVSYMCFVETGPHSSYLCARSGSHPDQRQLFQSVSGLIDIEMQSERYYLKYSR